MPIQVFLSDECIAALRQKKGDGNWADLAGAVGLRENTLMVLISRRRGVGLEIASRLADYLGLPLDHVFSRPNVDISSGHPAQTA